MSLVRTDIQTSRADTRADTRALVWEVPDPPSSVCQGESPLIDLKGGGGLNWRKRKRCGVFGQQQFTNQRGSILRVTEEMAKRLKYIIVLSLWMWKKLTLKDQHDGKKKLKNRKTNNKKKTEKTIWKIHCGGEVLWWILNTSTNSLRGAASRCGAASCLLNVGWTQPFFSSKPNTAAVWVWFSTLDCERN